MMYRCVTKGLLTLPLFSFPPQASKSSGKVPPYLQLINMKTAPERSTTLAFCAAERYRAEGVGRPARVTHMHNKWRCRRS